MINPMVVEGQTIGGVAQGIGTAFYDAYDDNGQPLASTLADLHAARRNRGAEHAPASLRDAIAAYRVRRQGHGRGRRHRAAGGAVQRGQRCAAPAGRAELLRTPLSPTRVLAAIAQGSRQPEPARR